MIFRTITAATIPIIATVAVGAGTVHAQSAPATDIGYQANLVGDTIVTTLTNGVFEVTGDTVEIKDMAGNTVVTLPLSFRQDGVEFPMPHAIADAGRVLELTPVRDVTRARPAPLTPVASPAENQRAQDSFLTQFTIATAIGAFIGTVIGAVVGLAGIFAGPTVIASVVAGAAIGGVIGTIVVGGPTLVIAGIDLIGTLAAQPGTTTWMDTTGR
ncbi:ammonium transporter [Nocardia australiensis]|uniref:ammonium transporter n=1 Tax=Nocardia australiensis TaxID=2887191 RepID=UPI001D13C066|nr:ammonium transporter [Nocardia australiensis]